MDKKFNNDVTFCRIQDDIQNNIKNWLSNYTYSRKLSSQLWKTLIIFDTQQQHYICVCTLCSPGVSVDQDQARLVVKGEFSSSQVRVLEVSKAVYLSHLSLYV